MPDAGFQTFAAPHLVTMALTLALPLLLAVIVQRADSETVTAAVSYLLAGVLLINEATRWGIQIADVGVSGFVQDHLPLHVCGIAVFLTAAALLFRHQRAYEVVYFWGLVGASNAVITPGGLEAGFPEYRFFQYFTAHSGIVAGVLFATWGLRMRPTLGGLVRAFVALNVLAVFVAVVNVVLGSNYMFLSAPPAGTVSPFFFAPWPWYIPILDVVALALFFVVYSPFHVAKRWRSRR